MTTTVGLAQLLPNAATANAQTVESAKAQAAAVAARLNSLGAQASRLLQNYDKAQASLLQVNQEIKTTQSQIAQSQSEVTSLKSALAKEAINDYMTGGNLTSLYVLFNDNPTQATVRQEFLNTVTNSQTDLIASHQAALQSLHLEQASLNTLQQRAVTVLNQTTVAKNSALITIGQEKAQLDSVDASIASLVAQQQAALAQQAAARARQIITDSQSNSSGTPSSTSGYANPLRAIGGLRSERVDQGVDYSGYGPIYAIGSGVVLSVFNGGWPGGGSIEGHDPRPVAWRIDTWRAGSEALVEIVATVGVPRLLCVDVIFDHVCGPARRIPDREKHIALLVPAADEAEHVVARQER